MNSAQAVKAKPKRRRRILSKIVLLCVVGLVCLVILEAGVRLLLPQPPSWLDLYRVHSRLPMALQPSSHAVVDTGETHWDVWTDALGHRTAETPDQELRSRDVALWIGDSFTFGHGVDYEQTWVGRLEALDGGRFSYINCGVPGYGPVQYDIVLDEALDGVGEVSAVFVATYIGNDFHDTIWKKANIIHNGVVGDNGSFRSMIARNLHSYRLATRILHKLAGRVSKQESALVDLRTPAAWKVSPMLDAIGKYRDAMASIARKCEARGIPLVVVLIPTAPMVRLMRQHGAALTEETPDERGTLVRALRILDSLELRVVDLTPELTKHDPADLFFRFDGHFRPFGHRVVEELLVRSVPELTR